MKPLINFGLADDSSEELIMLNNFTPAEQEIEFSDNWSEEDLEDLLTYVSSELDNEHGDA